MAFMRAEISEYKGLFIISDSLEEAIPLDRRGGLKEGVYSRPDEEDEDADVCSICEEFDIDDFEVVNKYSGCLFAPGYLDQTSLYLGDTRADVAQDLLDAFFDGPIEYMDEDERADMEWLNSIIEEEKVST